ncbi:MAG: hypothetical protein LBD58_08715 [Treponema sp.]|jgi:hypothetical protein|nr:hypothetical protein [Treponema sp.]
MARDSEVALYAKFLFERNIGRVKSRVDQVVHKRQGFNLGDYTGKAPDFPKPDVLLYDITAILTSPEAFDRRLDIMEARRFLFTASFADRMGIPARTLTQYCGE